MMHHEYAVINQAIASEPGHEVGICLSEMSVDCIGTRQYRIFFNMRVESIGERLLKGCWGELGQKGELWMSQ